MHDNLVSLFNVCELRDDVLFAYSSGAGQRATFLRPALLGSMGRWTALSPTARPAGEEKDEEEDQMMLMTGRGSGSVYCGARRDL